MKIKQSLTIPIVDAALILRAAQGLGLSLSDFLSKTFGAVLPALRLQITDTELTPDDSIPGREWLVGRIVCPGRACDNSSILCYRDAGGAWRFPGEAPADISEAELNAALNL